MQVLQDMTDALALADADDCNINGSWMVPDLVGGNRALAAEPYELEKSSNWWWFVGILSMVSAGMSTYHGYRRHGTVGAAIGWGVLGAIFPVITPAVALAQGFGQPKRR
jgi:hypothetical protein